MSLTLGSRLGHYNVTALIGEGGMGQVYQATDTKLNRQVALKILPEAFAEDPDRLARFQREAQVLASLNHPNIAAIHGLEESDGTRALVLELVEGPTLADRIAQGPIPLDEALPIAKQIAEALEAAHEAGVIHRDLKPSNIKVRDDGTVKVLDFGLVKAFQPDASDPNLSQSPTISLTAAATQMGMVIGTAAYMAPEQAKGKVVDKRADVWAFGAVLYEMLTGQRPFTGKDVSDTLAAVLRIDADFDALPDTTPPRVRQVLRACLQKEPKDRVRDIGDVSLAMDGAFDVLAPETSSSGTLSQLQVWQRPVPLVFAGLALLLLGGLIVWSTDRPTPGPVAKFDYDLPDGQSFFNTGRSFIAISPGGRAFAYNTAGGLYLRGIGELEARLIPGTTADLSTPFFSPDGQSLGYWDRASSELKRVHISGGAPVTITAAGNPYGVTWESDGTILYGQADGIWRVAGGTPELVIPADDGDARFHGPQMLPGGEWVLFTMRAVNQAWDEAQIVAQSLTTGERQVLIEGGRDARYVPTGHLLYGLYGVMLGVPFDPDSREVTGGPVSLIDGVVAAEGARSGAMQVALADNGSLVYVTGAGGDFRRSLVWVAPIGGYETLSLSPDGSRAAVQLVDDSGNVDVWVSELARGSLTRLTTHEAADANPLWSPDGRRVAFSSNRNGQAEIWWRAADGSAEAELLMTTDEPTTDLVAYDWSPDGGTLFAMVTFPETGRDIGMVSVGRPGTWEPLIQTAANEFAPTISPDGRWLAYTSDETGRDEVYVQRFPELEERRQISLGGGRKPDWLADRRELFFLRAPTGGRPDAVIRVTLDMDAGDVGTPEPLFRYGYYSAPVGTRRHHDVSPDGQRFLMITTGAIAGAGEGAQITVVLNWAEELKERVPLP